MDDYIIKPFFSIILPVFNSEKYITKTLESILNQTFPHFELIIIDDGSKDQSINILQKYRKNHKNIFLITLASNRGVSFARNAGLDQAKGEYVLFWDSDDLGANNKLLEYHKFIINTEAEFVYSSLTVIDEMDRIKSIRLSNSINNLRTFYILNPIPNPTACIKRVFIANIRFREKSRHEDFLFWHDIYKRNSNIVIKQIPAGERLTFYRQHSSSLSGNKLRSIYWRFINLRKDLHLPMSLTLWYIILGSLHYGIRFIKKF